MKKSILMAIVALALLAAPAFAGDYAIVGDIDVGWGWAIGANADDGIVNTNAFVNDFTMLGFFGSVDPNNSIGIQMEYGTSGSGANINAFQHSSLDLRGLEVMVTEFNLTTNILGAFGLTDLPVTLFMTNGFGRLNLHNRFQQWTGWEIKRWKNDGAAHFNGDWSGSGFNPAAWERTGYMKMTIGIMNMVNVAFGIVPLAGTVYGADNKARIPMIIDIWTSGIAVGPAALDICANLRADGPEMITGVQVTGNMNFGALALLAMIGVDYRTFTDSDAGEGYNMAAILAVKPSYNFGAGSVSLGAWVAMTMTDETYGMNPDGDPRTQIDMAVDVALSFSTATIYGGVIMFDLGDADETELATTMKYDIGIKNSFGAATLGVGVTGIVAEDGAGVTVDGYDIGAADGSGKNWLDVDGNALPTMYFRCTAWY